MTRSRSWRALFAITLLLGMGAGPVVEYAVAALAPFLVTDLGLSRTQIGAFTAVVFAVAALSGPFLGRLVDLFGGKVMLLVIFVSSGLALVLLAMAPNYSWFIIGAIVVGVAIAAANPATNKLVQGMMPHGRRGLVMGVKQSGVNVAQVVASLAMPAIAVTFGWRPAVLAGLVVAGAGGLLAAWFVEPSGPVNALRSAYVERRATLTGFVPWLAVYGALMGSGQAAVGTYLPLYAFEGVGLGASAAGTVAAIAGASAMLSRITWGVRAELVLSVGRVLMLIAVLSVGAIALIWSGSHLGPVALVLGAAGFGAAAPVWNVVGMLSIFRYVDKDATGRATGVVYRGFSVGFILGPIAFGAAVDLLGSYDVSWFGTGLAFSLAVGIAAQLRRYREHDTSERRT